MMDAPILPLQMVYYNEFLYSYASKITLNVVVVLDHSQHLPVENSYSE